MNNPKYINSLTLAYLGDAIYEVYVRKYLIDNNISKVNELQKNAVKYVSARGQSKYLSSLSIAIDNNVSFGRVIKKFDFRFLAFRLYTLIPFSSTSKIFFEYRS